MIAFLLGMIFGFLAHKVVMIWDYLRIENELKYIYDDEKK